MCAPNTDKCIGAVDIDELESAIETGEMDASSSFLVKAELEHIRAWRNRHRRPAPSCCLSEGGEGIEPINLIGLALSGGGIRSATFSLGVLQALAERKLLKHVDYLSTVSGGGYIGSSLIWWLSGLFKRNDSRVDGPVQRLPRWLSGLFERNDSPPENPSGETLPTFGVGRDDFPYGTDDPSTGKGAPPTQEQKRLLTYLRQHGKYLTPGVGITVMSGVAVVLRGVLLNFVVWLPIVTAMMFLLLLPEFVTGRAKGELGAGLVSWLSPTFIAAEACVLPPRPDPHLLCRLPVAFSLMLAAAGSLAIVSAIGCIAYSFWTYVDTRPKARRYCARRWFETVAGWFIIAFIFLVAFGSVPLTMGWVQEDMAVTLAGAGGLASGIWTFMRSKRNGRAWLSLGIIASVGAVLLIYGVLLFAYGAADWLIFQATSWWAWFAALALLGVSLLSGWFVNLNRGSSRSGRWSGCA